MRHRGLRDGHRQAQRALRYTRSNAQVHGGLLPGKRQSRQGRRVGGLRAVVQLRRRVQVPEDH